jgi:hypothetical protein
MNLYEMAFDSMGIYPMAVHKGKRVVKRTKWQEGWNECLKKFLDVVCKLENWHSKLTKDQDEAISYLVENDELFVSHSKEEIHLQINTNDIMAWALADADEISAEECVGLKAEFEKDKYAIVRWKCKKENMQPQHAWVEILKKNQAWDNHFESLPVNYDNEAYKK